MKSSATTIVILAAGESSRLGLPKQLLMHRDKSLLRTIAEKALAVKPLEVIALLGYASDRMRRELNDLPIHIVENNEWKEGIASSIRSGIHAISARAEAALFCVCDQPAVTPGLLSQIIAACSPEHPIAATEYGGTLGVPACFERSLFPELLLLQGDTGAKRVITAHRERVAALPFPEAAVDIDSPDDIQRMPSQEE